MAADSAGRIEYLRERIEDSDEISGGDKEKLLAFSDELALLRSQYSDHRHEKLLRHLTIMAEKVGGVADTLEDREASEELVRWIHQNYDNEETNRDYRVALRVFGNRLEGEDDEPPESINWISSSTRSNYDPAPNPSEMLRWESDVLPLIEATRNARDAAAIALAFDAGPRGGEFEALEYDDISDSSHGLQVTLRGKQGQRTVTLIPSIPYVRRWLDEHPGAKPSDPLWSKLGEPERLSYRMITKMLREPGKRANIDKPLTLTNFRKSSAAHLASKGLNQAHIEDHHGWVRGSKVASRYVSTFSEDRERAIARVYGKEVPEEGEDEEIAPLDCPRCGRETPREKELCVWCGQALQPGAAKKADRVDQVLVEAIANAEGEEATELVELRDKVKSDSELLTDVVDRITPLIED